MTTTNNTHPDFLRTLTAAQTDWCAGRGIEVVPNTDRRVRKGKVVDVPRGWGFFFSKGDLWIEPVAANASSVHVMELDNFEDGDGAAEVAVFDRLRDALAYLAANG